MAQPISMAIVQRASLRPLWVVFSLVILVCVLTATHSVAEQRIIKSHGISTFGDLKYGPDFKHLDYEPRCPQGGRILNLGFWHF